MLFLKAERVKLLSAWVRLNSLPDTINKDQMLFGINQGGIYKDLRVEHMKKIAALDIDAATLTEQAKGIYEDLKSSGLDLSQYGITDEDVNGFWALLKSLLERILSIFRGEG